ncbi:Kinase D-interacting substrate [Fulvia fulva]|uniref:Kinase D-interacting substrate n=1 Tax=Passalora fulva TaxID=5499 RepID=A0A9Q8LGQ6_PASFU|nr:Kinase D-interacting substrate [Fulvia fulva]KAK4626632.1 Kinase D-interacting substrate [Fulvia fulva]KAK4627399.1 Kinase D-interacting substrate [Fulvia fulva]UJO16313.1 Kinase D-interacting substrate [Fulvia fulva]WPV13194.1 Kinase D-interacting substrate [Fulvia fulva]WPV28038.1 Kinase D-interacting substrate [Fulvia fulva]
MKGDQAELSAALGSSHDIEERSRSMTPLQSAAHSGHYDLLILLITGGANVNAAPSEFGCALQATISSVLYGSVPDKLGLRTGEQMSNKRAAQLEAVTFLLEHGADSNASGGEFGSPVAAAAAFGSPDIVKLLLASGASPDAPGGRLGCALQATCARGGMPVEWCVSLAQPEDYTEMLELLLQHGSQLNRVGGIYGTALEAAAFLGDMSTVSRLLEEGADVNIRAGKYGSALGAAADQGHIGVVEKLLEAGARANAGAAVHPNDDWVKWKPEPISSLFLKYGAPLPSATVPVEERNILEPESPATLALRNGHHDIARTLSTEGV